MADPVLPPEMWGLWRVDTSTWLHRFGLNMWYESESDARSDIPAYMEVVVPVRLFPRDDNK